MEITMFVSILILILFLSLTLLPLALINLFSPNELSEMGIYLGNSESGYFQPTTVDKPKPYRSDNMCQLWDISEKAVG
jgi:hypothetical protein